MREDKLLSALIGLVGACGGNLKTENTDKVIVEALAFPLLFPEADEAAFAERTAAVQAEKNVVSPNCAHCACPCGSTSDYDMNRLERAEAGVREAKRRILKALERAAALLCRSGQEPDGAEGEFFCRALAWVSLDLPEPELLALLSEAEALVRRLE